MSKKELIQSLRKENLAKEFAKVGINDEFVADFNITVSGDVGSYTGRELQAKVLGTLTRQIRKKLKEMDTFSSLKAFIDKISFGSSVIEIDTLEEMKSEKSSNLIRLLSHCTKEKRGAWSLENYNDCLPIEMKSDYYDVIYHRYFTHDVKGVEYTFGNKVLSKRHDGSRLKLRGIGTEYFNLRDLANLSAKVLYVNLIEEFTVNNQELYYYMMSKEYVEGKVENGNLPIPTGDKGDYIRNKILNFPSLATYLTFAEDEALNGELDHFDLENDIDEKRIIYLKEEYIEGMIGEFLNQMNSITVKVDQELKAHSSYAKSFETKKHINKSTQEVMKHNHFLKKYGYVELDNLVDLDKFQKLNQEFLDLTKQIYVPDAQDHSFRVKRLGKHRASGIYFSGLRATIIDIDSPSSFIHELGHQFDFTLGKELNLSESMSFRHVADKYKSVVRDEINDLPPEAPFLKRWLGKSSYNSNYYFQNTEIFARCYEIYIKEKGIKTSFLKDEFSSPVYPVKDEGLLNVINRYFDDLFSFFEPSDEESYQTLETSANVKDDFVDNFSMIESYSTTEQLSLF